MFFIFYGAVAPLCSHHFEIGVGFRSARVTGHRGDEVCVNSTSFPFYFLMDDAPSGLSLLHYRSFIATSALSLYASYSPGRVPGLISTRDPFGSVTLRFLSDGVASFSFGSLPGLCRTCAHFTNKRTVSLSVPLSDGDDICVVLTSPSTQSVTVSGTALHYSTPSLESATSLPAGARITHDGRSMPLILRLTSRSSSFTVAMESASPPPSSLWSATAPISPIRCSSLRCSLLSRSDWLHLSAALCFAATGAAICALLFYAASLLLCPRFLDIAKRRDESAEISKAISRDALAAKEPLGYFAMDPVLSSMQSS